jgi:hypothetical protein
MKKLWSTAKAKRHVLARQRYTLKHRREYHVRANRAATRFERTRFRLVAPESFSLVSNPDETISFLNRIRTIGEQYDPFIDLSRVKFLSCDAIAVLIAAVSGQSINITGNGPDDPALQQMLVDSGFYDHVRSQTKSSTSARGKVTRFSKQQARGVNGEMASQMVDFARKMLGRTTPDKPTYAVLGEIMGNTFDHASSVMEGQVQWWATVYCDLENHKACYSFVDMGVGIMKSKSFNQRLHYLISTGIRGAAEQLRALLNRKIPSRSGVPYRGKGLPWVYDTCCAGRIKNLAIIANTVYSQPQNGVYRNLDNHFHGTFLYWET